MQTDSTESVLEFEYNRGGSGIKKEVIKLNKLHALFFEQIVVTDVNSGDVQTGLRVTGSTGRNYGRRMMAYIDADEINGMLDSLNYFINELMPGAPEAAVQEHTFTSRSGFAVKFFTDSKMLSKARKWCFTLKLKKDVAESEFYFEARDLEKLRTLVQKVNVNASGVELAKK